MEAARLWGVMIEAWLEAGHPKGQHVPLDWMAGAARRRRFEKDFAARPGGTGHPGAECEIEERPQLVPPDRGSPEATPRPPGQQYPGELASIGPGRQERAGT
jgi:hypothetical protein